MRSLPSPTHSTLPLLVLHIEQQLSRTALGPCLTSCGEPCDALCNLLMHHTWFTSHPLCQISVSAKVTFVHSSSEFFVNAAHALQIMQCKHAMHSSSKHSELNALLLQSLPVAAHAMQITHCSSKHPPDEIVRLVNCLELSPNGLVEYKSKVNLFVSK